VVKMPGGRGEGGGEAEDWCSLRRPASVEAVMLPAFAPAGCIGVRLVRSTWNLRPSVLDSMARLPGMTITLCTCSRQQPLAAG
jgi:hypothetical protein